jgi:quinol-cytochrome oxidoreductase complex cytochrome b subunit
MAAKSKKDLLVENAILAPLDWVDERTAAVRGTKWFLFRNVPRDVSWAQTLGSAALTAFIVMAVTGVILAMYYEPSASIDPVSGKSVAYTSIESITNELTLGWLVRGMHRWGASVFIILLFLHMGRVFLFGAYKYPRDLNGTAPFAGPWLAQFLAGGPEIGSDALAKFYALHMLAIPGALIALIGVHIYLVTRLGVTSPPWSSEAAGRERPPVEPAGARSGLVRGTGGGD